MRGLKRAAISVGAVGALLIVGLAPASAKPLPEDAFPSVADLVPAGATLEDGGLDDYNFVSPADSSDSEISDRGGNSNSIPMHTYPRPGAVGLEFPESVTATIRSYDSEGPFQILAGGFSVEGVVGTVTTDEPITVDFGSDKIRGIAIHTPYHGEYTVLVHETYSSASYPDRYTSYRMLFNYSYYQSPNESFTAFAYNYGPTGYPMLFEWIGTNEEAAISVEGPSGWRIYTGNGVATTSPATVTAPRGYAYPTAYFEATQQGNYLVTLTASGYTVEFPFTVDDEAFVDVNEIYDVLDSECSEYTGEYVFDDPERQLHVNGELSNKIVVTEGDPVVFGWKSDNYPEGTDQPTIFLYQVWGQSVWTAESSIADIPAPIGETAEITLSFQGAGCNFVRIAGNPNGDQNALIQVVERQQQQQPPAASAAPVVTMKGQTATISWGSVEDADSYRIEIKGSAPITTTGTSVQISVKDLERIEKGRKIFDASLIASNEAGDSSPTAFKISLPTSGLK